MTLLARGQADAARREAVALPPDAAGVAPVHLALALVEIRQGAPDAAAPALERALAADAQHAQCYAWQSYLLRARDDLAGAQEQAHRAVALAPHSAVCRQALADVLLLAGRPAEARREARQAVALNPFSSAAHVSLANAELLGGRVEAAVREAQQGVTFDPRSDRAHYTLGAALAAQRSYRPSERHLRQALELNPDLLDARALLGRVLAQQGARAEAVAVAQGTLDRSPDLPSAHAALGQVYRLQGRLREAARAYEAALALAPRNGLYHVEVARVYLDLNDMPAALARAQQGVFLLPGSSEAHAILGLVYDRQDNREQAAREYQTALSLSPENSLARLGLVTAFTPGSRAIPGSGLERLREQAQALLRDPAVLQQVFEPGVTSEVLAGGGDDSREQQRYLHRGQFARGRVHDLTVAGRSSDDGYRDNTSFSTRDFRTDVAIQAAPRTQLLAQVASQKIGAGLPESEMMPNESAYITQHINDYNAFVRQHLGAGTHLWLKYGTRSIRTSRNDPDAVAQPVLPGLPDMALPKINQRGNDDILELRLDRREGRHRFTYGLADVHANTRLFDLKFVLPGLEGPGGSSQIPAFQVQGHVYSRDLVQYLQDEYRLGDRGSLIAGAQWARFEDTSFQRLLSAVFTGPDMSPIAEDLANEREVEHHLLPYAAVTYRLGARSLLRVLGNERVPRRYNVLLAPSEAFIIGEPVPVYFSAGPIEGRAETYELDFERRLSPRSFLKLFLQYSRARDFIIQPSLEQRVIPVGFLVPEVRAEIAGLRFEHQINRYLSAFTRWSYFKVTDRTDVAYSEFFNANPDLEPGPNPSQGLQVPFVPRWRGLLGLNYVDRSGTKVQLAADYLGRRYTDVGDLNLGDPDTFGSPTFDRNRRRDRTGPDVVVDLRFAKEPSVRTEYSLTIANLFDASFPDNRNGFPTRGRTWVVSFAWRY